MSEGITSQVNRTPVTTRLDGSELEIVSHVFRGEEPGPTLTLISALHGSEWFSIEVVRRFLAGLDERLTAGTVVAVPVASPLSLEHFTRMTPDESDEPDLNRVWPGGTTWITEQIARTISESLLEETDVLVDFHTGPWGASLGAVAYGADLPDPDVGKRSRELCYLFGYPVVRGLEVMGRFPGPRSMLGYVGGVLGKPVIGPNLGGAGFDRDVEESWLDANVRGLNNIMSFLGMSREPLRLPDRYFHFRTRGRRVVPRRGGLLLPVAQAERMGLEVAEGELLGTVVSPYTFEVLEELRAPFDGVLFGVARFYPVRPGDWAFFVADTADPSSEWLTAGVALPDQVAR